MSLGERLKLVRDEMSQTKFAAELGVSKLTYARYEKDQRKPDADFLEQVCRKFGINATWLLLGIGPSHTLAKADQEKNTDWRRTPFYEKPGLVDESIIWKILSFIGQEKRKDIWNQLDLAHEADIELLLHLLLSKATPQELRIIASVIQAWLEQQPSEETQTSP